MFVTLAKKMVFGDVGIDGLYGPTETLIIADETANPTLCAADLLAQAEHDPLAKPVLVTTSERLARSVDKELEARLSRLERKAIASRSVSDHGCIVVVDSLDEALELSNWFAPEHMCLMVEHPWALVAGVRNAGALFIGEFSHEVLGDYMAGPSHVMPTGGTGPFQLGAWRSLFREDHARAGPHTGSLLEPGPERIDHRQGGGVGGTCRGRGGPPGDFFEDLTGLRLRCVPTRRSRFLSTSERLKMRIGQAEYPWQESIPVG